MRIVAILAALAGGCIHAPDRVTVSYQRDPDAGDEKFGVALSFPITYESYPWGTR